MIARSVRIPLVSLASSWLPWVATLLCLLAGQAGALDVSPASVTLRPGTSTTVSVTDTRGPVQVESSNPPVATAALSKGRKGATLTVTARAAGQATVLVADKAGSGFVTVTVTASMTVAPSSLSLATGASGRIEVSNNTGAIVANSSDTAVATATVDGNVVSVRAMAAGSAIVSVRDGGSNVNVPVTVTGTTPTPSAGRHALIAWNDLGMHCVDGKDYSVFSILPPFNNLHAQLVNKATGRAVTSGVTLTYEAIADPAGSINTTSTGKTNFWDWVQTLYGAPLASDVGLTGNATPSLTPRPMMLDSSNGWFEASGLPITPYDDHGQKNFYPTVKVVARDLTGKVLASTATVLPVSDEMTCVACHAPNSSGAARPAAGWVTDPDPERAWKLNILRLHDEKQATSAAYRSALDTLGLLPGLYTSAVDSNKPALCAACHASNALPGTGLPGVTTLTSALHASHGRVSDPQSGLRLDDIDNRSSCYMCHPGSVTRCLRGAMGNATDANGEALMGCQSCHGNMAKVGDPARVGWLEEPTCQACHYDGMRKTSALDGSGNLIEPSDRRFATNTGVPEAGFSLYRFSKGHGDLQCESCHGATHAEYPSSHENDNLQSIALQGHAGTLRECSVCHETPPLTASGGPHGLHTLGAIWVKEHHDYVESSGTAQCGYCHGRDFRGSPLAEVKVARTFNIGDGRTRSYAPGQVVGCYDCHNGPNH